MVEQAEFGHSASERRTSSLDLAISVRNVGALVAAIALLGVDVGLAALAVLDDQAAHGIGLVDFVVLVAFGACAAAATLARPPPAVVVVVAPSSIGAMNRAALELLTLEVSSAVDLYTVLP